MRLPYIQWSHQGVWWWVSIEQRAVVIVLHAHPQIQAVDASVSELPTNLKNIVGAFQMVRNGLQEASLVIPSGAQ